MALHRALVLLVTVEMGAHMSPTCCIPDEAGNVMDENQQGIDLTKELTDVGSDSPELHMLGGKVSPMFDEGIDIEYYSATHRRWLAGSLEYSVIRGTASRPPAIVYSVSIKSGIRTQVRKNVPPKSFRVPLEKDEQAEIISKDTLKWSPCVICAPQNGSRLFGYSIRLAHDGRLSSRVFDKVPAERLRRRFPEGAKVKIYQGAQLGWVNGDVDLSVEAEKEETDPDLDFLGAPVRGANISSASLASCKTIMPVRGDSGCLRENTEEEPNLGWSEFLSGDNLWQTVPVRGADGSGQLVPGFLVYPEGISAL